MSRLLPGQDGAFISILPSVGKRRSCRRSESSCVIFSPSCLFCCRRIENALFLYQSVRELFTNIVTPAAADPGMFDLETDSDWVLITDPHQNQPSSLIKDCSKRAPNRRTCRDGGIASFSTCRASNSVMTGVVPPLFMVFNSFEARGGFRCREECFMRSFRPTNRLAVF